MRTTLGNWRRIARQSRTLPQERAVEVQQTLIKKLVKLGILGPGAEFEDVLLLTVEDILKRRLQTLVFEKGFAKTIYQARQLVVHGHIQVKGKKINAPSYIVKREEDDMVGFTPADFHPRNWSCSDSQTLRTGSTQRWGDAVLRDAGCFCGNHGYLARTQAGAFGSHLEWTLYGTDPGGSGRDLHILIPDCIDQFVLVQDDRDRLRNRIIQSEPTLEI